MAPNSAHNDRRLSLPGWMKDSALWAAVAAVAAAISAIVSMTTVLHLNDARIAIENGLLDPVRIQLDGQDRGPIGPGQTLSFLVAPGTATLVEWTTVKRGGSDLGDDMGGRFPNTEPGRKPEISALLEGEDGTIAFFTPSLTNHSHRTCDVGIDRAGSTEHRLGVSLGPDQTARYGYFRVLSDMHLFVVCATDLRDLPIVRVSPASVGIGDQRSGELAVTFGDDLFGSTPSSSPAPSTTPLAECQDPTGVTWENHEPIFDLSIDPSFGPCQTIMVSSASFAVPNGPTCPGTPRVVCVVVARADQLQDHFPVEQLGGASWYGLTSGSIDAAIHDKVTDRNIGWFSAANCGAERGCDWAVVYIRQGDGTYVLRQILHP